MLKSILEPPVKSIPSFRPVVAMLIAPIVRTTPEIANHSFVLPIRSYFFQRSPVPIDPSTRGELMKLNPLRRPSIARVATTAVKIDVATPIRSISAKPFTDDVAAAYRMPAVISVTTLASMIVWNPRRYPVEIAARIDLPARTSSLMRSKMTMLASAATPIVRIVPAMPGRVIVTGRAATIPARSRP